MSPCNDRWLCSEKVIEETKREAEVSEVTHLHFCHSLLDIKVSPSAI